MTGHCSTNGVFVESHRWEQRKQEAASAVNQKWLTLREASEHFAMPEDEIAAAC
jgi:hypothetical protein